jgi:uncharacterized protein YbaP (TraB family)
MAPSRAGAAWLLACLTAVSWCRNATGEDRKAREPSSAASVVRAAPGFVYRAEKNGRIIFLAAALHRLRSDAYPLPAAYETAWRQCGAVWFEIDPREVEAGFGGITTRTGLMSGRSNVEEFLTGPTRTALRQHLASRKINPEDVRRMRPWYLGLHLMNLEYQRHGVAAAYGIDAWFNRRAQLEDKPVRGLEKTSSSVEALRKLSLGEQDRNLAETIRTAPRLGEFYNDVTAAWRQGDETAALRLLRPAAHADSESWRRIVAARTTAWMKKLESLGSDRPCMVVIGLDHLIGAGGVVRQLAARGYTVTAVNP